MHATKTCNSCVTTLPAPNRRLVREILNDLARSFPDRVKRAAEHLFGQPDEDDLEWHDKYNMALYPACNINVDTVFI